VHSLVSEIFALGEDFAVSYNELSFQHDIRILVVRTLLTYLESGGYLEGGTPFYAEYQFRPLLSSREILAQFEDERRQFLADLFRQARKAQIWFSLDLDAAASALQQPRERLVLALDHLRDRHMLELKVSGVRNRYRLLKTPADSGQLADQLYQLSLQREQREIQRLQQVLDWIGLDACQVGALCAHFDAPLSEPCGHCSWCLTQQATRLSARPVPEIDETLWLQVETVRQQHPQVLGHDTSLTRFLCGIGSPRLSRAKLASNNLFGQLAQVPFQQVHSWVSQHH
jgi:ATP-dependent DNA helicase RecQ